ncbi:hypothetical protein VTK26DRAFT_883 [Humicola hyalothermophila]
MAVKKPSGTIEVEPQTQPEQPVTTSANDDTFQDDSDSSSGSDGRLIEKFRPTVEAIMQAIKRAFPSSPQPQGGVATDPDPEEFRHYWHGVLTELADAVAADPAIPTYLTSPPTRHFTINLFDEQPSLCCPCSLPDVQPTIRLVADPSGSTSAAAGLTKTDLVLGLRDYLFGPQAAVGIYEADESRMEGADVIPMEAALPYHYAWISAGNDAEGNRVSYYSDEQIIVLYCCRAGEFEEKIAQQEAGEEAETQETRKEKTRPKSRAA